MLVGRSARHDRRARRARRRTASRGTAHWVARYTFGQTGRPVVNDVRSSFRFDDVRADRRRSGTSSTSGAGPGRRSGRSGCSLGWTPVLKHSVRDRAMAGLNAFRDR